MRIFLVDPPHRLFPGLRMWTPSFGLLSIGAYLQERTGFDVEILDCTAFTDPWGEAGPTHLRCQTRSHRRNLFCYLPLARSH